VTPGPKAEEIIRTNHKDHVTGNKSKLTETPNEFKRFAFNLQENSSALSVTKKLHASMNKHTFGLAGFPRNSRGGPYIRHSNADLPHFARTLPHNSRSKPRYNTRGPCRLYIPEVNRL
jgi:hypothetical protein